MKNEIMVSSCEILKYSHLSKHFKERKRSQFRFSHKIKLNNRENVTAEYAKSSPSTS